METVKERDHFVLCGWNQHTEEVLRWLNTYGHDDNPSIVLINELSVDEIDALKLKYDSYNLRFLRGNYVHEEVLLRANVTKAKSAVIMADFSGISDKDRADERTILSALTIKSLAPKLKIVAELLSGENKPHLKRANVDEIIVRGEHLGSLLASAVSYPGLPRVLSDLLSVEDRNKLIREKVPAHLIGKTFGELSDFLRKTKSAITIGMLKEKNLMKLEDMLSDDSSVIDRFIKEKIRESKKQFLYEDEQVKVIINPDDTMVLGENDYAVMLARQT